MREMNITIFECIDFLPTFGIYMCENCFKAQKNEMTFIGMLLWTQYSKAFTKEYKYSKTHLSNKNIITFQEISHRGLHIVIHIDFFFLIVKWEEYHFLSTHENHKFKKTVELLNLCCWPSHLQPLSSPPEGAKCVRASEQGWKRGEVKALYFKEGSTSGE